MTAWKTPFSSGVAHFRAGKYQDALECFSEALKLGGDSATIYDSRAAVYQKLGKLKDALRDAKAVIDLHPDRWQGYARSARLFLQARKYDAAGRMADLALERIPSDQTRRRDEITVLQDEIVGAQRVAAKAASRKAYHFGKLPVEIATAMFSMVLEQDHAYVVTLAQVCKNWRATILETPAFWRILVLGGHHPKRKVKVWRDRAKDRFHELAFLETFTDHEPVFEDLRPISMQYLRSLRVEGQRFNQLLADLPALTPQVLASLHSVIVQSANKEIVTLCPESAAALHWRQLQLSGCFITDFHEVANGLNKLDTLSVVNCSCMHGWQHLLHILSRNPSLASLKLIDYNPHLDQSAEDLPLVIHLPSLTEVHIEDAYSLANTLLPRLAAPSLSSLTLSLHRVRLEECLLWLSAGPARTLTTLSIHRSAVNSRLLIDVLTAATALESFRLTDVCDIACLVLKALCTPLDATTPEGTSSASSSSEMQSDERPACRVRCPMLRHLDVSNCPDVSASPIIKLVKMRHPETQTTALPAHEAGTHAASNELPVRPLESLVLDGCPNVDADVLPWLRSAVPSVSCIYMKKKDAKWKR
ncbi:hypothetical protein BV20DRAFT_960306 [Pilatotrama ljubarskyi]|nr:hypothetical protein BV20DRAFT_960306 [Pilatotrama ljubarskyi]